MITSTSVNYFTKILAKNARDSTTILAPGSVLRDPLVDIVIPVYNEEHSLPLAIKNLNEYLANGFPYPFRITVVDNASTDSTWHVAQQLSKTYPELQLLHLLQKGRGRALKQAWLGSDADILAYMDVDLSTDLNGLVLLIDAIAKNEIDLAIGSRLHKHARIKRSFKREFISRSYNRILRLMLPIHVRDAQCGFKAIRASVAKELLPEIKDDAWFFDTELIAKAERQSMSVAEIPVVWREDPDSRVDIIPTVLEDLRGIRRLRREFSSRSTTEKITIGSILFGTLVLYGYGALQNGYANSFYAAAVQAGTVSWKAFFYGSLDASNFITVDKPPVSLWAMEISTRIFGFHSWSMLLPEVLAGVVTVFLVYCTVRRWFSSTSALLAAGVMALTPVAVLMFGFDNPDAVLTLLLSASTYAFIRAFEHINPIRWLSISAILIGFAFNTKMLQGLIVLPVFVLVYLFAATPRFWQRLKHVLIAGIFLAVSALWWPLIVSAIPKNDRPYVGSSTNDSIWNLIVGYNGIGRLLGDGTGQGGGIHAPSGIRGGPNALGMPSGFTGTSGASKQTLSTSPTGVASTGGRSTVNGTNNFAGGMPLNGIRKLSGNKQFGGPGSGSAGFGGSTGVLRMFNSSFGPNIGWFIPLGLSTVLLAIFQRRRKGRSDKIRAAYLVWGGYLVLHIIVFSMVSGVIHPYYPVVMAPAVAALVGMGLPAFITSFRRRDNLAIFLPLTVMITAYTSYIILGYENWVVWLKWLVLIGGVLCGLIMLIYLMSDLSRRLVRTVIVASLLVVAAGPTVYALDTATVTHTGSIPSAGPSGTGMPGSNNESATAEALLVSYLMAHEGSAKWLVAVASADESAGIQISSGQPVMAIGGFDGSDDALSVTELKNLVVSGQLNYYAIAESGRGGMGGGDVSKIQAWVEAHGRKVDYGGSQYVLYKLSYS